MFKTDSTEKGVHTESANPMQEIIVNDVAGVKEICTKNMALRSSLQNEFNKSIYSDEKFWKTEAVIIFLGHALTQLNERKSITENKLKELSKIEQDHQEGIDDIKREITILKRIIKGYEETLLERKGTLNSKKTIVEIEEEIKKIAKVNVIFPNAVSRAAIKDFVIALQILNHPPLASQLSLVDIKLIVLMHEHKGIDIAPDGRRYYTTVYHEIIRQGYNEVIRRLDDIKMPIDYEYIQAIAEIYRDSNKKMKSNVSKFSESYSDIKLLSKINISEEQIEVLSSAIKEKVEPPLYAAFKTIYQALYEGQSGVFKINSLASIERAGELLGEKLEYIIKYSEKHPDSRIAKAWVLAQKHYLEPTLKNTELFTSIYKWSFEHSNWLFKQSKIITGMTFFRSSALNKKIATKLTVEQINAGAEKAGSRTAKIARIFNNKD